MKVIDLIVCECGLKFSCERYYKEHLQDVKYAKFLLKHSHKKKKVEYIEKGK